MNTPSLGSWQGIPASHQDNELMKRSMLYKVANEAAIKGKELTEANIAATKNSEIFNKFNQLSPRGGKKYKIQKRKTKRNKRNKIKSRRNKKRY